MTRPKIVVTSRIFPETLRLLQQCGEVIANDLVEPWSRECLLEKAAAASAMMAFMHDTVDAAFLDACPRLRIVACALKGYDNFDVAACTDRGVWLAIVPDLLTKSTAELAVGLMITLSRHIVLGDYLVRAGQFRGWRPILYGRSIDESVVGVLGGGAIGKAVAQRLSGFDCEVLIHDPVAGGPLPPNSRWSSAEEVAAKADFVVLALPLQGSTAHMVDGRFISTLKRGAVVVNVARGSLVNESDMVDAVESGRLGGYATDVHEFEDAPAARRSGQVHAGLIALPGRTLLTPHLGSAVTAIRKRIEEDAAVNIAEVLAGRRPHGAVNEVPVVKP